MAPGTLIGDPHVHIDRSSKGDAYVGLDPDGVEKLVHERRLDFVGLTSHRFLPLDDLLQVRKKIAGMGIECFSNREVSVTYREVEFHVCVVGGGDDLSLPNKCTLDAFAAWKETRPYAIAFLYHPGMDAGGVLLDRTIMAEACAHPAMDGLEIANEAIIRNMPAEYWVHQLHIAEDACTAGKVPVFVGGSDLFRGEDIASPTRVYTGVQPADGESVVQALRRPQATFPILRVHEDIEEKVDAVRRQIFHFDAWIKVE